MASVKKPKVLRFKNTPVKKEEPIKKVAIKKEEVTLSPQATEMIAQNTTVTTKEETITTTAPKESLKKTSWEGFHPKGTSYSVAAENPPGTGVTKVVQTIEKKTES